MVVTTNAGRLSTFVCNGLLKLAKHFTCSASRFHYRSRNVAIQPRRVLLAQREILNTRGIVLAYWLLGVLKSVFQARSEPKP